jgi:hypothetical protein
MIPSRDRVEDTPNRASDSTFRQPMSGQPAAHRRRSAHAWYRPRLKIPVKLSDQLRPEPGRWSTLKLGRYLGSKIRAMPIDPFAEGETREPG